MISAEEFLRSHPLQSSDQSGAVNHSTEEGQPVAGRRCEDRPGDAIYAGHEVAADGVIGGGQAAYRRTKAGVKSRRGGYAKRGRMPRRGGFGATASAASAEPLDNPCDSDACREAALRLLDYSARSSGALARRLKDKGYAESTVDDVIARLTELGLLDDESFAESVIRSCVGRLMGSRGALEELARKGVDRSVAARMVNEADAQGVFEDAVWQLGRQIARKTQGLDRSVRYRRLWSAGSRKGHSAEALRRVAQELLND